MARDHIPGSVHPRVCGEHYRKPARPSSLLGPSPRVRGTQTSHCRGSVDHSVHPRVCGEHIVAGHFTSHPRGPSPRVRGTLRSPQDVTNDWNGPSPRVRGTQRRTAEAAGAGRSIPACAGNTSLRGTSPAIQTVHPRVCGEHQAMGGSPCRVHRSIPACAGNTFPLALLPCRFPGPSPRVRGTRHVPPCPARALTVHPRVCGEHGMAPTGHERINRSIPACAGNTDQAD